MFKSLRRAIKQCFQCNNTQTRESLAIPLLDEVKPSAVTTNLMKAIQANDSETIAKLAKENFSTFCKELNNEDEESDKTPLQLVAEHGDLNVLGVILQSGIKESLNQALRNIKHKTQKEQRQPEVLSTTEDSFRDDLDCRIIYVGLFHNPSDNNLLYEKHKEKLKAIYSHLNQKKHDRTNTISRTQNQFINFFESHAPDNLKSDHCNNDGAAAAYNY